MKNKAINALIEMGMPADIKGFGYIVDAMCLFEDEKWLHGKTTDLYREIGRKNNTTMSRVERAIRHAFEIVTVKGYLEAVKKYLTMQDTTNGNLLHTLYLRLTQEDD
jgi:hypothetical protein